MFPRSLFAAVVCLCVPAFAGPPLTTIQDVLYKADGTPFNGSVTITWSSFQAGDNSTIVTQSTTVPIVNGNLRVQLVPTTTGTPPILYTATYNSDGRIQFQENWSVPASTLPVRLQDVRTAAAISAPDTSGGTLTTPIQETDVTGLVADLSARPLKGPGYAAGAVAVINASGAIESAAGSASDCVRVDGSSGPCGGDPPSFADSDTLTGPVDGSNASFTLSGVPNPASSLALYRNGLLLKSPDDYSASGAAITFAAGAIPQPGDILFANYRLSGSGSGTPLPFPVSQILCSGAGASTASTALASIGSCVIPAGLLAPGDRIEIRFDFAHQGSASGFSIEVDWGATTLLHRDASASETLVSGGADAAILASGAQASTESWGAVLPFAASVATPSDAYSSGLTINLLGSLAAAGDTLALENYSVVRVP